MDVYQFKVNGSDAVRMPEGMHANEMLTHISDKGLVPRIYKQILQLNSKKPK